MSGPTYNEDGDIVISEEEFLEIKRLKDLKQAYRNDFDELKNLKAEVQYCQRLVDQCRQRLIQGRLLRARHTAELRCKLVTEIALRGHLESFSSMKREVTI